MTTLTKSLSKLTKTDWAGQPTRLTKKTNGKATDPDGSVALTGWLMVRAAFPLASPASMGSVTVTADTRAHQPSRTLVHPS